VSTTPTLTPNSTIGIINRGEAAVRFIRAVREYNALHGTELTTAAFFIDAESEALFTKEADLAYPISGLPPVETTAVTPYLNKELMLNALLSTGCDGVWAGWGFVSEDAEFVKMVEEAGLTFLGPGSEAMALLGDKIAAKDLAERTDVPILPWSKGPVRTVHEAEEMAETIGYPCILKAAHAGGGRGIRFVMSPEQLSSQFASARDETLRITGDDILFMERLVQTGRHLEVQVLADRHGTVTTYGVRDCSAQRKNQKIIEETPPPDLDTTTVERIEAAAARLAKGAGYQSAGTVEFLYDLDRNEFYFMEVNTRLQVEHPITEQLYGIDLVKGQIAVAFGEAIPNHRPDGRGSVIEARLNAEDPDRDFTPAPGYVSHFKIPAGPGIRVDSGIEQGSSIPAEFDSMVAKIIAQGPTRHETLARLERALRELRIKIEGGTTNRSFLLNLLRQPEVRSGAVSTRFVEHMLAERGKKTRGPDGPIALLAAAVEAYLERTQAEFANFDQQFATAGSPRELSPAHGHVVNLNYDGHGYELHVRAVGENTYHVDVDGITKSFRYLRRDQEALLITPERRYNIQTVARGDTVQCEVDGHPYLLEIEGSGEVKAPSPSLVLSVAVSPGDRVSKGDVIVTLEAMKMEMLVEAPEDGVISEISVKNGEQVGAGQALLKLEAAGDGSATAEPDTPRLEFTTGLEPSEDETTRRELLATFLGHDHPADIRARASRLWSNGKIERSKLAATILDAMEAYAAIEQLFSSTRLEAEGFARPASYAELLVHYFRRSVDREKGLPEEFLTAVNRAMRWYAGDEFGGADRERSSLFRIYRSRATRQLKQELLREAIFVLEELPINGSQSERLANLLDEIAVLSGFQFLQLADVAIHARYRLVDRTYLEELRAEKREQIGRAIDLVLQAGNRPGDIESIMGRIVNSGHNVNADLVSIMTARSTESDERRRVAAAMLCRRFNRDRDILSAEVLHAGSPPEGVPAVATVTARDPEGLHFHVMAVTARDWEPALAAISSAVENVELSPQAGSELPTVEALVIVDDGDRAGAFPREVFEQIEEATPPPVSLLSVGVLDAGGGTTYRSFRPRAGRLVPDELRGPFNPLRFRELRVFRLSTFNYKVLYASEFVTLLNLKHPENERDERLFAFVEVPTTRPELDEHGGIRRMVAFENVFMEAVYAMRAEQAKRRRRLYWNRLIVHIRNRLEVNLEQIRSYAAQMTNRAADLGLERLVVYTRRLDPARQGENEVELLFENISGTNFTLRGRNPSREPLKTLDAYTARVVRARQRGTLYPYELVRMLTRSELQVDTAFPKGEFQEYDIEIDGTSSHPVPVRRPYGQAESNIVFGIVTNHLPEVSEPVRRVLVLADATRDMGSLSEPECRRVNAALDLAEEQEIPVEWIPISAGARIDMESGTENLDWTAATLRRIIEFTEAGGEINIIVAGINVGAQSYWNAEATMLLHTRGLLIMTEDAAMLLTGKRALDFSGSVSAEDNTGIGGVERVMEPNGQAQIRVRDLFQAYEVLFRHYRMTYAGTGRQVPLRRHSQDPTDRDIGKSPYHDPLNQGFSTIGDIFSSELNPERKKPFDMRQVMSALKDQDQEHLERWQGMRDAETGIVWETRIGGFATGLIGIESRGLSRIGEVPHDGPESWSGGTLFPLSSKKVARAINAFSGRLPAVILANLSGFDGSPESMRKLQLEYGAEIGRAVVRFQGPIIFVVVARYHGGAYVVFSKALNPRLHAASLEGAYASVIGGAPAAAVVFPGVVRKQTQADERVIEAQRRLSEDDSFTQKQYEAIYQEVSAEKQSELAQRFDSIHSVQRAKDVGSIDSIISISELRPYVIGRIERGLDGYRTAEP